MLMIEVIITFLTPYENKEYSRLSNFRSKEWINGKSEL